MLLEEVPHVIYVLDKCCQKKYINGIDIFWGDLTWKLSWKP